MFKMTAKKTKKKNGKVLKHEIKKMRKKASVCFPELSVWISLLCRLRLVTSILITEVC